MKTRSRGRNSRTIEINDSDTLVVIEIWLRISEFLNILDQRISNFDNIQDRFREFLSEFGSR